MPIDKSRYRLVNYDGGRILQARELNKAQRIERGFDDNNQPTAYELGAMYREGATMNVSISAAGLVVTLAAIDNTKPMYIFVRGRWEKIKTAENTPITLGGTDTVLYLNWWLNLVTMAQDSDLQDLTTGESTAEMGELVLQFSNVDVSAVALSVSQLEKNTSPIQICTFVNTGASLTIQAQDNAFVHAYGSLTTSGLVKLSTATSAGAAAANDDARLTDQRVPLDASVVDSKVAAPVTNGGTNADGTATYQLDGTHTSGVSAAKVLLVAATQTLEDGWNWLKAQFLSLQAAFTVHQTSSLGPGSHPMPTAAQVGAAPISHVGQPLGTGSHPPTATMNTGGFRLVRDAAVPANPDDYSFGTQEGGTIKNGLLHDGDVFSSLAGARVMPNADGDGALAITGSMTKLSLIAGALVEHVSKSSHKNPHGLAAADLNAATTPYVDSAIANVLASANNHTDTVNPGLTLRVEAVTGGQYLIMRFAPNNGNAIEIAYGTGTCGDGSVIPLPANFTDTQWMGSIALGNIGGHGTDHGDALASIHFTLSGRSVTAWYDREGSSKQTTQIVANWTSFAWRQGA